MSVTTCLDVLKLSPFAQREVMKRFADDTSLARELDAFVDIEPKPWETTLPVTEEALLTHLRRQKRDMLLWLILKDGRDGLPLEDVTLRMTHLADWAIEALVQFYHAQMVERFGVPENKEGAPQDLFVVGMGKLGAQELNVSSDIDLIFLYGEDGMTNPGNRTRARSIENAEFFDRLARKVSDGLAQMNVDGYVFRVDIRLRPHGSAGPRVCSLAMLEAYLYEQGRDWERLAWIKARVINTAQAMTPKNYAQQRHQLKECVRPFVFRKYLDFDAISSLSRLHAQIRAETDRREMSRHDKSVNIKLGRGGIREIEFLCQTWQLIRGGREASLRTPQTREALRILAQERILDPALAQALDEDYVFLRRLEHALQYREDEQTQWLPPEGIGLLQAAGLLHTTPDELLQHVSAVRERVSAAFDGVFQLNTATTPNNASWPVGWEEGHGQDPQWIAEKLQTLGVPSQESESLVKRFLKLVDAQQYGISDRAQATRTRFIELLPKIVDDCVMALAELHTPIPMGVMLARYVKLLEVIAKRSTYVALLAQYPRVRRHVGTILARSAWCADYVVKHPLVLDELLFDTNNIHDETPADYTLWEEKAYQHLLTLDGDTEAQMNWLREEFHAKEFQLLISDMKGLLRVERLADHLSRLADAVVNVTLNACWQSMVKDDTPMPKLAVIGYGKWGALELSYESDLDMVFLFQSDDPNTDAIMARFCRRVLSWLTLETSSGRLFDVDLRLRPNGQSGLLVTSWTNFKQYQYAQGTEGAWLWEHQALTRARFCGGDPELGRQFEALRRDVLSQKRDIDSLAQSVIAMRHKLASGHPVREDIFDVKHSPGGMVDVEFLVQFAILAWSHDNPELLHNFGNLWLLDTLGRLQKMPPELAKSVCDAYRQYRCWQHEARLQGGRDAKAQLNPQLAKDARCAVLALKALWWKDWDHDYGASQT